MLEVSDFETVPVDAEALASHPCQQPPSAGPEIVELDSTRRL